VDNKKPLIAAIIPCYNEEPTIAKVILDLRSVLPEAEIFVFDNNSTDKTAEIAKSMGAQVVREKRQGKGYVVQTMFEKVDADIYVMVDGDDTYDITGLNKLISIVQSDSADIIIGNRLKSHTKKAFRPFHFLGNKLVRFLVNRLFKTNLSDVMSGLRIMSRAFVKNINITSTGFEVETEMVLKALKYKYVIKESEVIYRERPVGSQSKLRTMTDGILVLKTILIVFRDYKPMLFFSFLSLFLLFISFLSGSVVIAEFMETRIVRHVPLAIFASGTIILSIIFFVTGIILDSINRRFEEMYSLIRIKSSQKMN